MTVQLTFQTSALVLTFTSEEDPRIVYRTILGGGTESGGLSEAEVQALIDASIGGIEGTALSDATPAALGTPSAGASTSAARGDHVHAMPTAADVGAATASDISTAVGTLDGQLATVAKTGAYSDLTGRPTLGTAAAAATGDFDAAGTAAGLFASVPDEVTTVVQAAGSNQTLGTSAVSVASLTCPALAAGDTAELLVWGSITNSTGGTATYTPGVKFGSSTLTATGATFAASTVNWFIRATIVATTTGAQEVLLETFVNNASTSRFNIASWTETTTGAVTIEAQLTSGSSSSSQTGVRKQAILKVNRA